LKAWGTPRGALAIPPCPTIAWIAEALDGLRGDLSDEQFRNLVLSIRATTGIEALVWLVDVACLSRHDAVALMRWSAQALFERAIANPPPTPRRTGTHSTRRPGAD
jgi:hypothetical protein